MSSYNMNILSLNQETQQQYPNIDIAPIFIQYMFSLVVIILINLVALYQFGLQMWQIYQQTNTNNLIHDIYDKVILHSSFKYIFLNIVCICYFHDLTSPPVQLFKVFWLYALTIVFMKFDIKQILLPALGVTFGILLFTTLYVSIWGQLPVFKIILILSFIMIYYGFTQAYRINKILNSYSGQKKKKTQISMQSLLQKNNINRNKNQYDEFTTNLELDQHIICHLKNRRSFCLVFSLVLIANLILYMDLSAGKELLGEVILSILLDILPLYTVYWYLKNTFKQKQSSSTLMKSTQIEEPNNQLSSRRTSKIVIQMVNLKS